MQLKIDARELEKLVRAVERMQKQVPQAIARGLNEGGDKVRTQVQHALQKQAGFIRYSSVTSRVRTARAFSEQGDLSTATQGSAVGEGMSYQIIVSGRKSKPIEFRTQVKKGPGGGVTVWMWGKAHKFKRSFEGLGRFAGRLLMRKNEKGKEPVRSFIGPNLAKEAVKDESARVFFATARSAVPAAVAKHLAKSF